MLFAFFTAGSLCSCVNYRIHIQVLPPDTYKVKLDDQIDKGKTDSMGAADFTLMNMSKALSPKISVENGKYNGFVVLDPYTPMINAKNLDTLSVVRGADGYRQYSLRFLVDKSQYRVKHNLTPAGTPPQSTVEIVTEPGPTSSEKNSWAFQVSRESLHGINDNPQYARKIAAVGATCNFIGMGLNYATFFIPTMNSDSTINVAGLLLGLGMSAASGPLQIAGTSYAVGGAKLAWELGETKCESWHDQFDLWTYYKGGWVFVALNGVFGIVSEFVPRTDRGTALTVSLISLGLNIGRDVFWSIADVKALSMTRKIEDCLGEQKMPAHHLKLELEPYATRGGAGGRCSLLF